jgi:hypothetical protein
MSLFIDLLRRTANTMPHVVQHVPEPYVALGVHLRTMCAALLDAGVAPVCTRADVADFLHMVEASVIGEALDCLAARGLVLSISDGIVVLHPPWLASTLARVVVKTCTRAPDGFPEALLQRGMLFHDKDTLAAVWPELTNELRRALLGVLHAHALAVHLHTEYSLVPDMLPSSGRTLDGDSGLFGPLVEGEEEVSLQCQVACLRPNLWANVLLCCGALLEPSACFHRRAVLQWGGQRALLSLDRIRDQMSLVLVCRGSCPVELRVRVYWMLVGMMKCRYPFFCTDTWLHFVCHECHDSTPLFGGRRWLAKPFVCGNLHGDDEHDVALDVKDIVSSPVEALDTALEDRGETGIEVAGLCRLAARVVDTADVLRKPRDHRAQLWLPMSEVDELVEWVSVCEDPAGWHCHGRVVCTSSVVDVAVMPVLQRVARVVLGVGAGGSGAGGLGAGGSGAGGSVPGSGSSLALALEAGLWALDGARWAEFSGTLAETAALVWHSDRWVCEAHACTSAP